MSKEKRERNKKICEDKKTMSWAEMIRKWGMNYTTLRNIVKRGEKKK